MKILITGGAGFIGSHLVDYYATGGNEIYIIDDFNDFYSPAEKHRNIEKHHNNEKVKIIEQDITSDTVIKLISSIKPEVIVHLAARAGVRPSIEDPVLYERVNCLGTINILDAARISNPQKLIFASSSSVYGNNVKIPFSESDRVDFPISPYAATKKFGEQICFTYHYLYHLPIVCLRFFTVYGPRQRPDLAIRKFMSHIYMGNAIEVYGDGSMKRDFTYIDDIIHGITNAVQADLNYQIINLGNSKPVSVNELISAIEKVTGLKSEVKYLEEVAGDVKITYADTQLAERLLNFKPNTPLDVGLEKMYEWLKDEI